MLGNRSILGFGIFFTVFSSCIEPYTPNSINNAGKYVVYGQVTNQEGYQTVSVSTASSVDNPTYNPLSGCTVKIINNHGDEFLLTESEKGNYQVWMGHEYLTPGDSFKLYVLDPTGIEIVSDFEQLPENPGIDSVYYLRKDVQTSNIDKPLQGIQFYIDVDGKNTNSHFYRIDLIETWEHHALYPKTYFWNTRNIVSITPPDYSKMVCWTTQRVQHIYTLSTEKLLQNKYRMYQLHFVDNNTQRLTYCYSLLINQFALSEPAYKFWSKLQINNNEQVGLYEIQPLRIKGNLRCTSNPVLEVLGFFSAASMATKRIFVRDIKNLGILYPQCHSDSLIKRDDLKKGTTFYLMSFNGVLRILAFNCVECDFESGSNIKPEYWPY